MTVYLIGAGPGDPGLLTVRATEVLAIADVVVHDRLAEASLLDLAPPSAERIYVGKDPGGPLRQEEINALLVERGRAGQSVVRLKGGDPFVFGRGGEEAEALLAAGVAFEVVPGISSALAVPAYAGVPVTHRGRSASFTVVTGHSRQEVEVDTNWEALAAAGGTIVVLMGVAHRAMIAKRLMLGGLAEDTPVVATRWGTRPEQQTVRTDLAGLATVELEPPVTIVIGAVAGLDLGWFERRPLLGRRVVVTRERERAALLSTALRARGAAVVELPLIATAGPEDAGRGLAAAVARLATYDWVVFTSAQGVIAVRGAVHDVRAFGPARVAAVGPATAKALQLIGVVPDLVAPRADAVSLGEALTTAVPRPGTVLLPQAGRARPELARLLRAAGWEVTVAEAYRTVAVRPDRTSLDAALASDVVTFTSPSAVESWHAAVPSAPPLPLAVCIGATTAEAARAAGFEVAALAREATPDALADAVAAALAPPAPPPPPPQEAVPDAPVDSGGELSRAEDAAAAPDAGPAPDGGGDEAVG
ncbi:MAG TPA: uroporphyrinogen-III C-methyltransferase [Acidimicrobiales bacterium]|nr:uroporphyrinogen-III C-methyltransferase [Acidimicrobiales bacterium]